MFWRRILSEQFRKPSGLLGHISAGFMAKNNPYQYEKVVELLELKDQDRILEIGCGAGRALKMVAARNSQCHVDGLDFSRFMLKRARKRDQAEIRSGQLRIIEGDFRRYDFGADQYSKIFAINVVYFWEDLAAMLVKIRRLLSPAGRLVLFMLSPERLNQIPHAVDGVFNKYSLETVRAGLLAAGFGRVRHETVMRNGFEVYFIVAE